MNKILIVSIFAISIVGFYGTAGLAYAQYMGNVGSMGETGASTLEETLQLARDRVAYVDACPDCGSGTPYLDATGILGSTIIAGAVFGGMAGALFLKGRQGKYAAQGRG